MPWRPTIRVDALILIGTRACSIAVESFPSKLLMRSCFSRFCWQEEEDFDDVYDEHSDDEDEHEKLHYPKQIYDRVHDVSPLIIRLGLDEYAPIFEDQQINFDSFLTLEVTKPWTPWTS